MDQSLLRFVQRISRLYPAGDWSCTASLLPGPARNPVGPPQTL